jgi:hypothetical protein
MFRPPAGYTFRSMQRQPMKPFALIAVIACAHMA